MSEIENSRVDADSSLPVPGLSHAVSAWERAALDAAKEPDYQSLMTASEYLEANRPKTARRINERVAKNKQPRRGQRRVIKRYDELYQRYVDGVDEENDDQHDGWRANIGDSLGEAYILSALAGDEDQTQAIKEQAKAWQGGILLQGNVALGLIAIGRQSEAKTALLKVHASTNGHIHNLLDAYAWTRDEDYRNAFMIHSQRKPYLLARLVSTEKAWRGPDVSLLRHAQHLGGRIALAAAILEASQHGSSAAKAAKISLNSSLEELQPPRKKYITTMDRAAKSMHEEGFFGAIDALFEGIDAILGDTPQEKTPEYIHYIKDILPVIDTVAPILRVNDHPVNYSPKDSPKIYARRSDYGDKMAGPQFLMSARARNSSGQKLIGGSVYRNVLRDFGPNAASAYLALLPKFTQRSAAYHTLLHGYMLSGRSTAAPKVPKPVDTYSVLRALHIEAQGLVESGFDQQPEREEDVLRSANIQSLIGMTDLLSSRPQDLRELIQEIKTIEDRQAQAELLQALIDTIKPSE